MCPGAIQCLLTDRERGQDGDDRMTTTVVDLTRVGTTGQG
jgi:hypothetical protein